MKTEPQSVPEQGRIRPLPSPATSDMTKRKAKFIFEEVKVQVMDLANKNFDQSLRIIHNWLAADKSLK